MTDTTRLKVQDKSPLMHVSLDQWNLEEEQPSFLSSEEVRL